MLGAPLLERMPPFEVATAEGAYKGAGGMAAAAALPVAAAAAAGGMADLMVGPGGLCSPRHRPYFRPSFLDIICSL